MGRYSNHGRVLPRLAKIRSVPVPAERQATRSGGQRQRRLRPDEIADLVGRYADGATPSDLGTAFGIHHKTVLKIVKRNGSEVRRRRMSDDDIEEARQLRLEGWTLVRLGARFEVDPSTVRRSLSV